jgi:hypothetical protein
MIREHQQPRLVITAESDFARVADTTLMTRLCATTVTGIMKADAPSVTMSLNPSMKTTEPMRWEQGTMKSPVTNLAIVKGGIYEQIFFSRVQ